jgi:hypothetical protein
VENGVKRQFVKGQLEAMKLALACFTYGISRKQLQEDPNDEQVRYATFVAKLRGAKDLTKAYAYLDSIQGLGTISDSEAERTLCHDCLKQFRILSAVLRRHLGRR